MKKYIKKINNVFTEEDAILTNNKLNVLKDTVLDFS
jgi:hypothetical protein